MRDDIVGIGEKEINGVLNDFRIYLEIIQKLNRAVINTYSVDPGSDGIFYNLFVNLDKFCSNLFKILDVKGNKGDYSLSKSDGLMLVKELKKIYDFSQDLDVIISANMVLIESLKVFRNKIVHQPHNLKVFSVGSVNEEYDVKYKYKTTEYRVFGTELCNLTIRINKMVISILQKLKSLQLSETQRRFISKFNYLKFEEKTYLLMNDILRSAGKRSYQYLIDCKLEG